MFTMYWIFTLLLILLKVQSLIGKCTWESKYIECVSVDEEEILSFINRNAFTELTIENSYLPHVEILTSHSFRSLSIKYSRVKTFLPKDFPYLQYLDLSFNEIQDIGSMYYVFYLRRLVLHHNQIEFLNGSDLPHNIVEMDLSHNNIRNFTELPCRIMQSLNLSHNLIEKIANLFKNLGSLQKVDLSFNKLRNVNADEIENLGLLESFNLSHNDIISFQYKSIFPGNIECLLDFSFNKLNLSDKIFNTDETNYFTFGSINLADNDLKNLNFLLSNKSRRISGKYLTLRSNKIKELYPYNFKGFTLQKVDLSLNEIKSVLPFTFGGFKVSELRLEHNKITSLNSSSFFGVYGLTRLNLSFNPLETIDELAFGNDSRLWYLDLSHCLLRKVPVGLVKNLHLSELYLSHNNIEIIKPNTFSALQILDLSNNKIKILPGNVFSGLKIFTSLDLSHNPLISMDDVFNNTKIRNVSLNGISLSNLTENDVRGFETLEYLDLSNTSIVELTSNTFDQLSSLKTLILDNNSIQTIPNNFFGFSRNLSTLSILRNPISIISSDSFPHKMTLKRLYLTLHGKIKKKRFFNLIFLEELHFVHSLVTEIQKYSFKGLINLNTLNFQNSTVLMVMPGAFFGLSRVVRFDAQNLFANVTTLKSKTFVGLDSLGFLNFSSIGISAIEDGAFYGLHSLSELILSRNKIGNLPKNAFVGLKKLKVLDLSYNNLTGKESTFPIGIFKDLIELTDLHLQHNRIIKFHIGEFSNLRNLRFLNMSHNQLSYLDRHLLFPLRNLEVLDINSNHVIKFDYHFTLKHLSSLKTIGIGENKWPCENMTIMLNDFEQHGINYREISKLEFDVENIGGIYCVHVCNYLYCPTEEDLVVTY